jgi:hypothetical protein
LEKSGSVSRCLDDLALAGFIQEDCTWNLFTKAKSRLKKFRLKDNYLRFYLRYIEPNKNRIVKNIFESRSFMHMPGWESVVGLHFENLVVNNLKSLCRILRIDLLEVINAGPFFQRATQRQKGCQIDLMIQTRHNAIYVCEIKFSTSEVKSSAIEEMGKKIRSLSIPKGSYPRQWMQPGCKGKRNIQRYCWLLQFLRNLKKMSFKKLDRCGFMCISYIYQHLDYDFKTASKLPITTCFTFNSSSCFLTVLAA